MTYQIKKIYVSKGIVETDVTRFEKCGHMSFDEVGLGSVDFYRDRDTIKEHLADRCNVEGDQIIFEDEFTVIKNKISGEFGVIKTEDIIYNKNYCETFAYGQTLGCGEECYGFKQKEFISDGLNYVAGKYNIPELAQYAEDEAAYGEDWANILSNYEGICKETSIHFLNIWSSEKEDHFQVKCYEYWDGSNWETIILEPEFSYEWEALDTDDPESIEVLSEMPDEPYYNGVSEEIETENHKYIFTKWASDPFVCTVDPVMP